MPAAVAVIRGCAEWDGADLQQMRFFSQESSAVTFPELMASSKETSEMGRHQTHGH